MKRTTSSPFAYRHTSERVRSTIIVGVPAFISFVVCLCLCLFVVSVDAVLYAYACVVLSGDAVVSVCCCASVVVPVVALSAVVVLTLVSPFFACSACFALHSYLSTVSKKPVKNGFSVICAVFRRVSVPQHTAAERTSAAQQNAAADVYPSISAAQHSTAQPYLCRSHSLIK